MNQNTVGEIGKKVGEIKKKYDREDYVFVNKVQQKQVYKNGKQVGYGVQVMPRPKKEVKNEGTRGDEKNGEQKNINQIAAKFESGGREGQNIYEELEEENNHGNLAESLTEIEGKKTNNIGEETEPRTPNENYDTGQNYTQKMKELDKECKHGNLAAIPIKTEEKNSISEETETQKSDKNDDIERTYVQREKEEKQKNNVKATSPIDIVPTENFGAKKVGLKIKSWFLSATLVSNSSRISLRVCAVYIAVRFAQERKVERQRTNMKVVSRAAVVRASVVDRKKSEIKVQSWFLSATLVSDSARISLRVCAVSVAVRFAQEKKVEREKANMKVVSRAAVVRANVVSRKENEIKVQSWFFSATLVSNSARISLRVCAVSVAVRFAQEKKVEKQKINMKSANVYSSFGYLEYRVKPKSNMTNGDNIGNPDQRENTSKCI